MDFKDINKVTMPQSFPIPLIDEIIDLMGNSEYFSTLDLYSAYYQIKEDRELTAFQNGTNKFQFTKMAMGLVSSSMTWQKAINMAIEGMIGHGAYSYLDDIIIYAKTKEEHIKLISEVLARLRKYNFKLKTEKCVFLKKEITYLGHIISKNGIRPNPKKTECVAKYPIPETVKQVQRFLGCVNYYRKYIPEFARKAKPLYNLCKKDIPIIWTESCKQSFDLLKKAVMNPPVLALPNPNELFILTTDASQFAIAAVLSQGPIPNDRPVQFMSKTLTEAQVRYAMIEKELLAIIVGVETFRHFLYGKEFLIVTDHKPLLYIMNHKNPNSRLFRWKLTLQEYQFKVTHIKGQLNVVAVALSRIEIKEVDAENKTVKIITRSKGKQDTIDKRNNESFYVEAKCNFTIGINEYDHIFFLFAENKCSLKTKLEVKIKKKIELDPKNKGLHKINDNISACVNQNFIRVKERIELTKANIQTIFNFSINNGYNQIAINVNISDPISYFNLKQICKEIFNRSDIKLTRFINKTIEVTELEHIDEILHTYHKSLLGGHVGIARMKNNIRRHFSWQSMTKDIKKFIKDCDICERSKVKTHTHSPMEITSTAGKPFEKVFIDLVGVINPKSVSGNCYIFTCICDLSKYVIAVPIPDATALTVAQVFNS